jgi:hypothetical protein
MKWLYLLGATFWGAMSLLFLFFMIVDFKYSDLVWCPITGFLAVGSYLKSKEV